MTDLYAALQPLLDEHNGFHQQQGEEEAEPGTERPVQLAIMGLPNVVHVKACLCTLHSPSSTFSLSLPCLCLLAGAATSVLCSCLLLLANAPKPARLVREAAAR